MKINRIKIWILTVSIIINSLLGNIMGAEDKLSDGMYAEVDTTKGKILLTLEFEKTPMTVCNFAGLAEGNIKTDKQSGQPYYDGLKFHRVIDDFMVQGGCPLGTGTGGPGYSFPDEFDSSLRHSGPGILSMANSGPGTNGSQFFITHVKTPWLDDKHTVFGHVVDGQDVVNKIKTNDKINSIKIIRVGEKATAFLASQESFDKLRSNIKSPFSANLDKSEEYMSSIAKTEGVVKTKSGLCYKVLKEGSGNSPQSTDEVTVHYEGKLINGNVFDSSIKRNKPATFKLNRVISGWTEGLSLMKEGGKNILYIPHELAYGKKGASGVIPPNSALIFEVELLKVGN